MRAICVRRDALVPPRKAGSAAGFECVNIKGELEKAVSPLQPRVSAAHLIT